MAISCVYLIKVKGECIYVGSTCDFYKRISEHKSCSGDSNNNTPLYKYLRENNVYFKHECKFSILERVEYGYLRICEQYWINKYKPICNKSKSWAKSKTSVLDWDIEKQQLAWLKKQHNDADLTQYVSKKKKHLLYFI
jgi:hypothetical protein